MIILRAYQKVINHFKKKRSDYFSINIKHLEVRSLIEFTSSCDFLPVQGLVRIWSLSSSMMRNAPFFWKEISTFDLGPL